MKMVHCISDGVKSGGGEQVTQFVDGFQAAQQLKTRYPDQFRLLSTVKMDFCCVGHDAIMMSRHPTIKCVAPSSILNISAVLSCICVLSVESVVRSLVTTP